MSHSLRPFLTSVKTPETDVFRAVGRGGLCTINPGTDTPAVDVRGQHRVTGDYSSPRSESGSRSREVPSIRDRPLQLLEAVLGRGDHDRPPADPSLGDHAGSRRLRDEAA